MDERETNSMDGMDGRTLRERGMAMPTMKRKKGMAKSARLQPFHGACPMTGHSPPAPSTSIISCI